MNVSLRSRARRAALLAAISGFCVAACEASATTFQRVALDTGAEGKGKFAGMVLRPEGKGPFPVVVAMHGCGGLLNSKGEVAARERDWAERLVAAGYAVLLTDSFNPRGYRQICTVSSRQIAPRDRAVDAAAAAQWLAKQPWADGQRLALMGWSHGAMSVLWTVRPGFMNGPVKYKTAIAFYPGCREVLKQAGWKATIPLTMLLGAADDWTVPGPCRELAATGGAKVIEYAGAYHGFDAPNSPVRVRTGLATVKSGKAHVGTNAAARAAAIKDVGQILNAALRTSGR